MRFHEMRRIVPVLIVIAVGHSPVLAQQNSVPGQAREARVADVPVALEGYCAVCLMRGHRWVKGTSEHSAIYDGRRYVFPSKNEKQAFVNAPSE
jgi:YHS domain-containing protein